MFCEHCGKELLENEAVCSQCGANIESVKQDADGETKQNEEFVVEETVAGDETDLQQTEPPKKKKTGLIVGICAAAAVLAIAALVIFNFNFIKGYSVKLFGSDTDYLRFVEKNAFNQGIEGVTEVYSKIIDETETVGTKATLKPQIGDSAKKLIEDSLGGKTNVDWINDISLSTSGKSDGENGQATLSIKLSESEILTLDTIVASKERMLYLALSNLSDKYIKTKIEVDESSEEAFDISQKLAQALNDPEFKATLPSEKELEELLKKYSDTVIAQLEAESVTTMYMTVGEINGEYTVVEYHITEEDFYEILETILEMAKEDEELKEIIESVCGYLADKEIISKDVDCYGEFKDAIDEMLESVKESKAKAGDDEPIIFKNLVNAKHEICGRIIEADGKEVLSYITVQKGTKIATEFEMDKVKVEGEGEVKSGKLNAKYTLKVDNKAYAYVNLEDVSVVKLGNDTFEGTIKVEFTDSLIDEMDEELSNIMKKYNFSLVIKSQGNEKNSNTEISILSKGELFAGLVIGIEKVEEAVSITVPSDAVDSTDKEAVTEWAKGLDTEKIVKGLRDGGLDGDLVTMVETLLNGLKSQLNSTDSAGLSASGGYVQY